MMLVFALLVCAIYIAVLAVNLNKALQSGVMGKSSRADRPRWYWIQVSILVIGMLAVASLMLYTLYYIVSHITFG
jgi:hypothetical protein